MLPGDFTTPKGFHIRQKGGYQHQIMFETNVGNMLYAPPIGTDIYLPTSAYHVSIRTRTLGGSYDVNVYDVGGAQQGHFTVPYASPSLASTVEFCSDAPLSHIEIASPSAEPEVTEICLESCS